MSKIGVDYEHSLFFMNPNCLLLQEGLKRVNSDESVMEMAKLGVKFRAVAIYILKVGDDVELEGKLTKRVPKLSVKRPSRSKLEYKKQSNSSGPLPCEESDSILSQDPISLSTFIPTPTIQCPPPNPTQALKDQIGERYAIYLPMVITLFSFLLFANLFSNFIDAILDYIPDWV